MACQMCRLEKGKAKGTYLSRLRLNALNVFWSLQATNASDTELRLELKNKARARVSAPVVRAHRSRSSETLNRGKDQGLHRRAIV